MLVVGSRDAAGAGGGAATVVVVLSAGSRERARERRASRSAISACRAAVLSAVALIAVFLQVVVMRPRKLHREVL